MSLQNEYLKIKTSAGLFDFSSKGKIRVDGHDRIDFLHNILSNDIKALTPGKNCRTALLSATGKVLAMMDILANEDHVLLITECGFEKQTIERLDKFIIIEDVQLSNVTDKFDLFSIEGPESEHLIHAASFPQNASAIIDRPFVMAQGCAFLGTKGLLETAKSQTGLDVSSPQTTEILRIENGRLRYGVDITDDTLLPETGLEDLYASETKGCYPGQEVVAKIKTYGRLNRKIVKLYFETEKLPRPGDKIYSGDKAIGRITSSVLIPNSAQGAGIGILQKNFYEKSSLVITQHLSGYILN